MILIKQTDQPQTRKFIFWALVTALCCALTYMVFVHRRVIRAAIKGEPLPEPPAGKCCHKFCKKK